MTAPMVKNSIVIEAQKLNKSLPVSSAENLVILKDINLNINQGESIAITGESGSGKTTLLGLLAGLDAATQGDVVLLGESLSNMDEDQRAALRRGNVGFVFQSFHLMDNLTALENVMLPLEIDPKSRYKLSDIREQAKTALQKVGLAERLKHLPTQLSGGEQQRVALARAFVTKPSILFADEPTGNLDKNTGDEIIALLFSLQQQNNTTLVMVTHDDNLADRCGLHYRLQDGGLVLQ